MKTKVKLLQMKTIISDTNYTLDEIDSRLDIAGEKISEFNFEKEEQSWQINTT